MVRDQVKFCPVCRHRSRQTRLARNGGYPRRIPTAPGCWEQGWIYRKFCSRCRISFSLLPGFILPRQRYALTAVAAWLWAWLNGSSTRCRKAYLSIGISPPESDECLSWTDALDQSGSRTRPGYQLLHRWSVVFQRRASEQIAELVRAFFEELAGAKSRPLGAVARKGALALAWVHWDALWQVRSTHRPVDRERAFREFIRHLARERSHLARRASGGVLTYDALIIVRQALPP